MVKNSGDLFMKDEDLRTLLKLRGNRIRINALNQDLLEDEIMVPENSEAEKELIENLKMIDSILENVRISLTEL